jgi:hypothetical protein
MTDQEWLECTNPEPMLSFLKDKASDRKFRLFAVACCRRFWHQLKDERCRLAIEVGERFVDGQDTEAELAAARTMARSAVTYTGGTIMTAEDNATLAAEGVTFPVHFPASHFVSYRSAESVSYFTLASAACESTLHGRETEALEQVRLLRELFSNPYHPVVIDNRWLTSTVVELATAIYQDKAFDRMPVLADALMDAGCNNEEMIAHCRGAGPHVRGCWVLDLLLGKN